VSRGQPFEHRSTVDQIGQIVAYGHSILAGNGATDTNRDIMTRLAAMLGAKEYNYAKGGSVMMWTNAPARNEFGIIGQLLHTWKRPVRPASALSGATSIGATTVPVTPNPSTGSTTGPAFAAGDVINIGAGTASEYALVIGVTSTNLDLVNYETPEYYGGLLRAHSSGDPVYKVPTHYGAGNTLFLFCEATSQISKYGSGGTWANAQRWYQEALRLCISRMRAAEEFNPDHTALKFTGSWGAAAFHQEFSGSVAAQGARNPTVVNDSVTFSCPDNFPGGDISFNFFQAGGNTGGGVWTFTVDGAAWTVNGPNTGTGNTLTTVATPTIPINKAVHYCARLRGLTAGRHSIVAQMTTLETNDYFDSVIIEAEDPPIVLLFKSHRFASYDGSTSSDDYGYIRPTLQAQANPGATSIAVNQSPNTFSRQLLAGSVPKAGEILVIEPTEGNASPQEVRTVTSVTGTGPFTINFSGGALANTHVVGTRCELGVKDYDIRYVTNAWMDSVMAEFDDYVTMHDPDPYIKKDPKWFHVDYTHFNDKGNAYVVENVYRQLVAERRLDPRASSRLSRPVTIPSSRISFVDNGPVGWIALPAAISEFPTTGTSNGGFRRVADLSRYYEARIGVVQTLIGASGSKLRIQYSIDQGATWRQLHRIRSSTDTQLTSTDWTESASASDTVCQIDLGAALTSNGVKYTQFEPIYAEAIQQQYQDVMLRVMGIGGDGVGRPQFQSIWVEFR
jgi:hypothetical protein